MSSTDVINITEQKAGAEVQYEAMKRAIDQLLPGIDPFVFDGRTVTRSALQQALQDRLDASRNTKAARLGFHKAVEQERLAEAAVSPLRASLKAFVLTRFGKNSPQVQAFGFTQNKRPSRSAKSKALAVDKGIATRKARHTMGKQQKKAVKGDVTGVTVTPTTADKPVAPATTGGPAATPAPHNGS
jgi:hypothetical protein